MSHKDWRPQIEPKASERMARVWILLIIIAIAVGVGLIYTGKIKPYQDQGVKVESTPVPDPPSSILPPKIGQ